MFSLKPITSSGIAGALQKAERYRLLNDPSAAESICLDILEIDPDNQQALVTLVLARADQLAETMAAGAARAREVLPRIKDEYQRAYYEGVIHERHGNALRRSGRHGSSSMAYDEFRTAMECYERAEPLRPSGDDDPVLRWNTCARILNSNPALAPEPVRQYEPVLGE